MSRKLRVAEGIIDSAAEEYRDINLKDVDAVIAYATSMDIELSYEEAEKVREACLNWVEAAEAGKVAGSYDYYAIVTEPLEWEPPTSFLSEDEVNALVTSNLRADTPYLIRGVSHTMFSTARYAGGAKYNGNSYTYLPPSDELIRDDVLKFVNKLRRKAKKKSSKEKS